MASPLLRAMNRSQPDILASWSTVTWEVAEAVSMRAFGSAAPMAFRASTATRPPPTMRAAPQMRSVQAQALSPPTNTYTVAQRPMMVQPAVMLRSKYPDTTFAPAKITPAAGTPTRMTRLATAMMVRALPSKRSSRNCGMVNTPRLRSMGRKVKATITSTMAASHS